MVSSRHGAPPGSLELLTLEWEGDEEASALAAFAFPSAGSRPIVPIDAFTNFLNCLPKRAASRFFFPRQSLTFFAARYLSQNAVAWIVRSGSSSLAIRSISPSTSLE